MRTLALVLLALLPVQAALAQITQARVTGGEVSGVAEAGVSIFRGIPFAAPPVGELRWKAPAPVNALVGCQEGRCVCERLHAGPKHPGQHRAGQ